MATLDVKTVGAEQVWQSPDKKITIFKVTLDYQGKTFLAKTYSKAIATDGWSGTVESYEKTGRNGAETFVKQPAKEGGWSGGGGKSYSKPQADPFTMFLSYAKDLAVACTVSTPKGVVFDSTSYSELLDAVSAGGMQLYEARPDAKEKAVENVKEVFGETETVTDADIDQSGNLDTTELPL